jgi:hypothetical protein
VVVITLLLTGGGNIASLIPVGAAIIGGLIGFSGAMIASRRANKTAYDLVSYSRVQDRRYEALATLYGYAQQLYEVLNSASQAADAPSLLEKNIEYQTIAIEANDYLRKNMLWLPGEATEAFTELLLAAEKLPLTIDEIEVTSITSEEYFDWFESQGKQNQQEIIDWFRNQGYEMLEKLHQKYADMVGLEKTATSSLFPE